MLVHRRVTPSAFNSSVPPYNPGRREALTQEHHAMIDSVNGLLGMRFIRTFVNVNEKKNVNVNVVYSGRALSFEIASLGMPLKHSKQIT